ncbi:YqhV family protein [Brevibacillus laterosporus]|uniref:YqhV family protein n=1 Tax=Brevibacillus laterosporus TaxID=1465 RepID=UPI00264ABA3A|nr:YqhV family protein [Brevibacillus laterosporus]MDN9009975.1 YqhV family protein [Brevibacillus laterosporus]MDO0940643.1 YqhV family protein [Brevibacillus laterosporus]
MWEKAIIGMASLRLLSGSLEIIVALLILKVNQVEKALIYNSGLALVGPIILLTTTTIGMVGISDKLSLTKILWIFIGVTCILIGVKSK